MKLINDLQVPVRALLQESDPVCKNIGLKLEHFVVALTQTVIHSHIYKNLNILFPLLEDGVRCLQTVDKGTFFWDAHKRPPFNVYHPLSKDACELCPVPLFHVANWTLARPFETWISGSKPPHSTHETRFYIKAIEKKTKRIVFRTSEMYYS
eukprot:UN27649